MPGLSAGGRQLRDVAPFEGARQLALTIDALPAPKGLKVAAAATLPAAQLPLATLPSAALQGGQLHCLLLLFQACLACNRCVYSPNSLFQRTRRQLPELLNLLSVQHLSLQRLLLHHPVNPNSRSCCNLPRRLHEWTHGCCCPEGPRVPTNSSTSRRGQLQGPNWHLTGCKGPCASERGTSHIASWMLRTILPCSNLHFCAARRESTCFRLLHFHCWRSQASFCS